MSSTNIHDLPLPYGWVKQYHESGQPYYVDTKATPPRSIWTHPLEDEQYLREHPDAREKVRPSSSQELTDGKSRSGYDMGDNGGVDNRRHSYNGESSRAPKQKNRGFFGKLKDKAIGTKEEREAERVRIAQLQEQRRQQQRAQQQAYYAQAQHGPPQQQYYGPPQQQYYGPPQQQYGGPGYGGGLGGGMGGMGGMGGGLGGRRGGGGMGGMALPLVGGLAGGLLLGDVMGGGFGGDDGGFGGDGGGFGGDGGGDFGGGDFGGGDF